MTTVLQRARAQKRRHQVRLARREQLRAFVCAIHDRVASWQQAVLFSPERILAAAIAESLRAFNSAMVEELGRLTGVSATASTEFTKQYFGNSPTSLGDRGDR